MDAEERIQAVSQFLLQSPPGEINDVLNGTLIYLFISKSRSRSALTRNICAPVQMYACSSGTMRASKWAFCLRCNSTTSINSRWQKFQEPVIACVTISSPRSLFFDFGPCAAVYRERKSSYPRRAGSFPRSEVKDELFIRSFVLGASGLTQLFLSPSAWISTPRRKRLIHKPTNPTRRQNLSGTAHPHTRTQG